MTTTREVETTAEEVARLIGVTYRQLDYWSSHGWLRTEPSPGTGHRRMWTPDAIRHASIVGQLVNDLGMRPTVAADLADRALSNTGSTWSVDQGSVVIAGRLVWVPGVVDEDDEVET